MTNAPTAVEKFDALVLGSGEAGKYLSWSLGAEGKRVALVERRYVGGSCPNIACLPSKNVVHSAKVAWYARRLKEFGLNAPPPGIDMTVVRDRKRAMVNGLVEIHNQRFAANHVEFIRGRGVFARPRTLSVELEQGGVRSLAADTVIVSTGSRAIIPDIAGLREAQPMTHVEELGCRALRRVVDRLVRANVGKVIPRQKSQLLSNGSCHKDKHSLSCPDCPNSRNFGKFETDRVPWWSKLPQTPFSGSSRTSQIAHSSNQLGSSHPSKSQPS